MGGTRDDRGTPVWHRVQSQIIVAYRQLTERHHMGDRRMGGNA